jgi:hypothetical protein
MKVSDLKQLLEMGCEGLTDEEFDNLDVLMALTDKFDGYWKHPCSTETGVAEMSFDEDGKEDGIAFCIVPLGFFDDESDNFSPELN